MEFLLVLLGWLAEKVGGTVISEKFKQRFLKPKKSSADDLLDRATTALEWYARARAREDALIEKNERLRVQVLRLLAENRGLIEENERLQRGRS